jgi:predicted dehydrogenase
VEKKRIWLIGAGPMANAYVEVLSALGHDVIIVGRGEQSAERMRQATRYAVVAGGLGPFLESRPALPDAAIVAVGVEALAATTAELLDAGVRRVLVEKPAALTLDELHDLQGRAALIDAEVYIGYNRRAYASVQAARAMIEADGGATSLAFEFTEWAHQIGPLVKAPGVKERWALGNSTHVIDLAFYLAEPPKELSAVVRGGLDWHPSGSVFTGSGVTESDALFSYHADWTAPGRWAVEVMTRHNRYVLRPLEALDVIRLGTVRAESVPLHDEVDRRYKPGLYQQVVAFLDGGSAVRLCTLDEQVSQWGWFTTIAGYRP